MKVVVATRFGGAPREHLGERFPDVQFLNLVEGGEDGAADAEVAYLGPDPERLRALLRAAPRLRWVHTISAGVERLLIPELLARDDLVLTNNSGAYDVPIAEFALATIFAASKRLPAHLRAQLRQEWSRADRPQHVELREARLVVLGLGSIGAELARLASGVGMRVIGVRRSGAPVPGVARVATPDRLGELAREADYLAVTCPLTPATRGLVSREVIAALPGHAWIVNIARGAIVDEAALFEALRERRIGGAAIDAWWEEPLPVDSPWWQLENVIVSPHRSHSSPRVAERTLALFADNLWRYREGRPLLNVVDKTLGY